MGKANSNTDGWGSRVGLILAMAGNAVGLGNFLRFPVKVVQNGGGEFIIPYLISFLLMGIPLLWVEWGMGRYGGKNGDHSTPFILDSMGKKRLWKYVGIFGIFTNLGVISYYTYIESWTLAYVWESIAGTFQGLDPESVAGVFNNYVDTADAGIINTPWKAICFFLVTLVVNIYILSRGLSGGVEKAAKIAMPLLLVFGAFLAIRGITLGNTGREGLDSALGMNFLWGVRDYSNIWNFKVWLEAAGQVFFTLSVGMGTIHCYASYVRKKDDIALNAMSAGFMNGFVEIVLGASIVIPIAVGYMGLDWVVDNAGFMMAFQTMPYLFDNWGAILALMAGVTWFGLLFFAGITSSLAMGTPWMGFMKDEFNWSRKKSAWTFGLIVLILALPTIFFFEAGVFDEYDFWTGTVSLVVFALIETILFAWVFGINNAWNEINGGADIKIPTIFKYIIKYVTPVFILVVFVGSLISPKDGKWDTLFTSDYELDSGSIIGKIQNKGVDYNNTYFADFYQSEKEGQVTSIEQQENGDQKLTLMNEAGKTSAQLFTSKDKISVSVGDQVELGQSIATGSFINKIFFIDMSRILLVLTFIGIGLMIRRAAKKRKLQA